MASQFKCKRCNKIYITKQDALECCLDIMEHSQYQCLHCEQFYDTQTEAEKCCCEPIEIHDINTCKALLLPLWLTNEPDGLIPEFIVEHAENRFKIWLPFTIIPAVLQDAMRMIFYISPLIEITPDSIVLNCENSTEDRIVNICDEILEILNLQASWSYLLIEPDHIQGSLSSVLLAHPISNQHLINQGFNTELIKKVEALNATTIHFDIFKGQCWVTNHGNHTVMRIDYINHTIQGPDSIPVPLLPEEITQANQEAHNGQSI